MNSKPIVIIDDSQRHCQASADGRFEGRNADESDSVRQLCAAAGAGAPAADSAGENGYVPW
jgi:hypothetical protein